MKKNCETICSNDEEVDDKEENVEKEQHIFKSGIETAIKKLNSRKSTAEVLKEMGMQIIFKICDEI